MLVIQLLNAYDLQNFKRNIKNQRDDDASFKLIDVLYKAKNYNFIIKKNRIYVKIVKYRLRALIMLAYPVGMNIITFFKKIVDVKSN